MNNYKMIIDVSDIWQKYVDEEENMSLEDFIDELVSYLDTKSIDIGDKFGEEAQIEYEEILFNIQHNVDDHGEFDYYWDELYSWSFNYNILLQID